MVKRIHFFKSRFILLWIVSILSFDSYAQFTVKLTIKNYPSLHSSDSIFIAGNFNQWDPHNLQFQFNKNEQGNYLELKNLPANFYEFKLTRGNWNAVESNADGSSVQNRLLHLVSDTIIELNVAAWQDDFVKPGKTHTSSVHVSQMDSAFVIPQLGRTRKIWLYLPEGYATNKKKYPVLYMHDGQNVFDNFTAPYGEWGVDECLDSLIKNGRQPCIVVGIENDSHRMNEYNPCNHEEFGKGEGNEYIDFIATTLKPYIDKHYRTLSTKENTIIAGSSMGGLISYYVMLKYPDVFAKAGIFSPSFWAASEIDNLTDSLSRRLNGKLFFYVGENEGKDMVADMMRIQEKVGKNSSAMLYAVIDKEGKHNEATWQKWFPEFYNWIMAAGFNIVTKSED
jgi:predicted alpha/beta superfamily hydrolase